MTQHHDPVHPDSGHLSAELIADLHEGLLDDESGQHATQHLAHCTECAAIETALRAVPTVLRQLPAVTMPASVADRLSAALTKPASTSVETTVLPLRPRRGVGWSGRGLGIAAVAAAVLLVGALVVPSLRNTDNADSLTAGAQDENAASSGGLESQGANSAAYNASTSGTDYTPKSLDQQVDRLITDRIEVSDGASPGASPSAPTDPVTASSTAPGESGDPADLVNGAMATNPVAAQACVDQYLTAAGIEPLAIDIGTFDDAPAAIVVLPIEDKPTKAEVWVIDPSCSGAEGDTMYYATIDRP